MKKLYQLNDLIDRKLPLFVLVFILLGIFFPDFFSPLCNVLSYMLACLTFINSLDGSFRDVANVFLRPLPVIACLAVLHVALPLAAAGLSSLLLPNDPLFAVGLTFVCILPTAITALLWVGICNGTISFSLSIILLDTLLSPLILPISLKLISGSKVSVDVLSMTKDMLFMVAIPAFLAMLLHRFIGKPTAVSLKQKLSPLSKVFLLAISVTNGTRCAPLLKNLNLTLVKVIVVSVLLTTMGYLLSFFLSGFLKLSLPDRISFILSSSQRNTNAGAVLAAQYFPAEVLFPLAFVPVYVHLHASIITKILIQALQKKVPASKAD